MPFESRLRKARRERQWLIYADSCGCVSTCLWGKSPTHLICDFSRHVPLGPLQSPESLTKVELNVITFTLHTHSQQDTALTVEIQPVFSRQKITKMRWVQLKRSSTNTVVVSHRVPVPDRSDDVQWALGRNIHRFIPPRVQVAIYNPRLGQAFLIFITKNDVGIAVTTDITSLEIFCLDNFDCKDVIIDLLLALRNRRCMALNDSGARIYIDLVLQFIKLGSSKVNIVELYEGLEPRISTVRSDA